MVYIFLAMIFYAVATLFMTSANRNINTNLSVAIVNTLSALIPLVVIIPLIGKKLQGNPKFGIAMAVAGGVCIALFGLAFAKALSVNKVGVAVPIVFGGSIFISTVASFFVFKEKLSTLEMVGLGLVGFGLVAIVYARSAGK